MAPKQKRYSYILFLASLISVTSYAQDTIKKPTFFDRVSGVECVEFEFKSLNNTATMPVANLDISNQFIVELSNPKDGFAIATDELDQIVPECEERSSITAAYSALVKDIIENYKYDFSETFINILFFDDIDLARKRTI